MCERVQVDIQIRGQSRTRTQSTSKPHRGPWFKRVISKSLSFVPFSTLQLLSLIEMPMHGQPCNLTTAVMMLNIG